MLAIINSLHICLSPPVQPNLYATIYYERMSGKDLSSRVPQCRLNCKIMVSADLF